jgi:hypothetical protein
VTTSALGMNEIGSLIEESVPASRLGRWLMHNRVEFEAATDGVRHRWQVLATRFAKEKLISVPAEFWDEEDTPARQLARKRAAQAVRQVWYRVKRRHRPQRRRFHQGNLRLRRGV